MKYIITILYSTCLMLTAFAQSKDEPIVFEKFFKKNMKATLGAFPVYQDGQKYFIEISPASLNSDILVIGDVFRGPANNLAQSSGIIRFNKGVGNNLNVTKEVFKEAVSPDFNQGFENLVQKSNLIPISYVMPIEAKGKETGSYIIDITKQLMEGGDLFSFKDLSALSSSDPSRSGVQQVTNVADGVVFSVLRTQTSPSNNGSKSTDKATAFLLNLGIQKLPKSIMTVKEADPRIGFGTVSYNDFGKNPYGVRNVKVITKWALQVADNDKKKYNAGELVNPVSPIKVYIDKATPSLFVPYLKAAVEEWNLAFQSAGFKNALVIGTNENENYLSAGKILIKWGNAYSGIVKHTVTDPRTGEILAAKMNISDNTCNDLLPSYFAKCGHKDARIRKDLYHPEVRGEIMQSKVSQTMGELFGMVPNLHGSAAYTNAQLRSSAWMKTNGISSSVTDDMQFNFVVQPEDKVNIEDLMPKVSTYDKMAIGWAYRLFLDQKSAKKAALSLDYANQSFLFLAENATDPYARRNDLSSNQLEASILGMKNIERYYPQIEILTGALKGSDEDWSDFKLLSNAFQKSYQIYMDNVASLIGGESQRVLRKNYNDIPVIFTPKEDQKKAMAMLNTWVFSGVPAWMQNKRLNELNGESEDMKMQSSLKNLLKKMITPVTLGSLIKAEYALGKKAYTAEDLFEDLDHYVFKDFNTTDSVNAYTLLMQTNFVFEIADAEAKNNYAGGLSDTSELIHLYYSRTLEHVREMAKNHKDPNARAHYNMILEKLNRDRGSKQS